MVSLSVSGTLARAFSFIDFYVVFSLAGKVVEAYWQSSSAIHHATQMAISI